MVEKFNDFVSKADNFVNKAFEKIRNFGKRTLEGISVFVVASIFLHLVREKVGVKDNWVATFGNFFSGDVDFSKIATDPRIIKMVDRISQDEEIVEIAKREGEEEVEIFMNQETFDIFNKEVLPKLLEKQFTLQLYYNPIVFADNLYGDYQLIVKDF